MNNQLPDKTVLISIFLTIILIFSLIFLSRPATQGVQNSIEWRESQSSDIELLEI